MRHGESEGNKRYLLYGHTDYGLTDLGEEQAREVGEKMKSIDMAHCYSSPLSRASDTAKLAFGGRDLPITYMDGLMEQHMGDYEDVSFFAKLEEEPHIVRPMAEDWTRTPPPNGESYQELCARAVRCYEHVLARGEDAVIVAHNGTLSALIAYALGGLDPLVKTLWLKQGCYSAISYTERGIHLEYFNK